MKTDQQWKVLDLINTTTHYFSEKGIENSRLNAERLLGHTLGLSRVQLYVSFERPVTAGELYDFREKVKRRAKREPLQYILGETEFMGLPFLVNQDVLIPRPETEILIEEVLSLKSEINTPHPVFLDIGTGSGCIAIALAKLWQEGKIIAMDKSQSALAITASNCDHNQVKFYPFEHMHNDVPFHSGAIHLMQHDIFSDISDWHFPVFDVIISNPPYISKEEMMDLAPEVKDFEPWSALTDHSDGIEFYRRIFQLVSQKRELKTNYLCLEMSGSQPDTIINLASEFSFESINVRNDLNQIPRVLIIKVNK